jgi:DNA gyrase/topoisomerase IV subunit A
MTFPDKIEEWIKEAEARPSSALMVLKLIANRLRDLSEQNETLLNENIALRDGSRVDEYQKRIRHLEYQLEMLKRRVGSGAEMPIESDAAAVLLVYNAEGRVARIELAAPGKIEGQIVSEGEFPRFLALPADEEILLLFTSGRIATCPVSAIQPIPPGASWAWEQAAMPDEPHAGERLACVMPLGNLSISDYFMQVSRRGWVKKTLTTVAQSVLDNAFLGRGAVLKSDQAFDVTLAKKKSRYVLVTYEGRALALEVEDLSYAVEERIRLSATDYIVGAFILQPGQSLVCVTQNGKVIQRAADDLELAKSAASRGQGLISGNRLAQGTRFIGAAGVGKGDQIVALDAEGQVTVHLAEDMAGAGSVRPGAVILSIGVIPAKR